MAKQEAQTTAKCNKKMSALDLRIKHLEKLEKQADCSHYQLTVGISGGGYIHETECKYCGKRFQIPCTTVQEKSVKILYQYIIDFRK